MPPRPLVRVAFLFAVFLIASRAHAGVIEFRTLREETNEPIKTRVVLQDKEGRYIRPVVYESVVGAHSHHFYSRGVIRHYMTPGREYSIAVDRGIHWIPRENTFVLEATAASVTTLLRPFADLRVKDWLSGDLDLDVPFHNADLVLGSADLYVGCRVYDATGQVKVPESERGIHKIPHEPVAISGNDWRFQNFNVLHPLPTMTLDETPFRATELPHLKRAKDLAGWVDVTNPENVDAVVAAGLGWVDSVRGIGPHRDRREAWPEERALTRFEAYYRLLDCGFEIPISAGSMAGELTLEPTDRVGSSRVYVRHPQSFSYGGFFKALKRGNAWATNGPVLIMGVNGKDTGRRIKVGLGGKIRISVGARSPRPLSRIEVLYNGVVAATVPISATADLSFKDFDLPAERGGWLAARCFEASPSEDGRALFAHTCPTYIQVGPSLQVNRSRAGEMAALIRIREAEIEQDPSLPEAEKAWVREWFPQARARYETLATTGH
ncbi:MAG: CehA/McbA family metallohydrolase [Candidatus Omnitrophica bacterium]|nr:hypothetical protein [bacterium]NUN94895.1 CehA/McbA family metallohydrolase [Candidatus Omnitrophota bacterium]